MSKIAHNQQREFASVIGWNDEQQKSRRKNNSALPWFKFYVDRAHTPLWLNMSAAQRGDYLQCLILASETGNTIDLDPKYLRTNQLNRKKINFLNQVGLIHTSALPTDHQRFKDLRSNLVNNLLTPEGEGEEDKTRQDKITPCASRTVDGEKDSKKTRQKIDRRDFESLKTDVKKLHDKFEKFAYDDDQLFNCGGQSLRITRKQFDACMKQLRQDGEL